MRVIDSVSLLAVPFLLAFFPLYAQGAVEGRRCVQADSATPVDIGSQHATTVAAVARIWRSVEP